jgi:hypothetical protein
MGAMIRVARPVGWRTAWCTLHEARSGDRSADTIRMTIMTTRTATIRAMIWGWHGASCHSPSPAVGTEVTAEDHR